MTMSPSSGIGPTSTAGSASLEIESVFRLIAESVPVMVRLCDATGAATYINRLWREVTGQSASDALGNGWHATVHPDDRPAVLAEYRAASVEMRSVRLEYRLLTNDSTWARVMDQGEPILSTNGELLGHAASIIDISQQRNAELALQESDAFFRSVLNGSPDCVRLLDLEGNPLLMNQAGREMFGLGPADALDNQRWDMLVVGSSQDRLRSVLASVRRGGTTRTEGTIVDAEGRRRRMDVIAAPVFNAHNEPARVLTIWRDITEAHEARARAETAAARLTSVLESTLDGVIVVDSSFRVRYVNANARRLLHLGEDAIGARLGRLFPAQNTSVFAEQHRQALQTGLAVTYEEYLSALDLWLEVHAAPTDDGLSIFFRDTSARRWAELERSQAQRQILHMSRHDALTGLPNRLLLHETIERHLNASAAGEGIPPAPGQAEGVRLAVLTLGLDQFKAVNDAYGHHAGDVLLRAIASRLSACVEANDMVARTGDDEFVVIRPGLTMLDDVEQFARVLVGSFSEPLDFEETKVSISVSVGIALTPEDGRTADEVVKASDVALYRAKAEGRNTCRRYVPEMGAHLQTRQLLKLALRGAIERNELEVHYQPLIALRSRRMTACEALLRWQHPDRGWISPAEFIPIAEETGLIVDLGEWVLREACWQSMRWSSEISVAVNLSPLQFKGGRLVRIVREALRASGLAASRLQLEITEAVLLNEDDANLRTLQELRSLGVRIAMDDFGTGYSSLGYLRRFPFDKIKVDRSFVSDLPSGKESLAVVRAIAGIGRSLGITTTVEGVETEAQLAAIAEEGFDEAQGFLFAKPLSATAVLELMDRQNAGLFGVAGADATL